MMNYLTEFDGKPFQSVSKLTSRWKNWLTKLMRARKKRESPDSVHRPCESPARRAREDVRLTHRLTDTPAIVSTDAEK